MSVSNRVANVVISIQDEAHLPDVSVRQSVRDDFVKGDVTTSYDFVTIVQGDQQIIVPQVELRKTLNAIFPTLQ